MCIRDSLTTAVGFLWRQDKKQSDERIAMLQVQAKDREERAEKIRGEQVTEMMSRILTLQQVAASATAVAEQLALNRLKEKGLPIVDTLAAVVPIHHSPSTENQILDARMDTLRARLAAVTLAAKLAEPNIVLPKVETAEEVEAGRLKHASDDDDLSENGGTIRGEIIKPAGAEPVPFEAVIKTNGNGPK